MNDIKVVIANDLPYAGGNTDPFGSLNDTLCFSSNDWGSARDFAWIYGIVCGWDSEGPLGGGAMDVLAARFGWSNEQVARLRVLHANFKAAGVEWGGKP